MRKEFIVLLVIGVVVVAAAIIGSSYYQTKVQNDQKPAPKTDPRLVRPDSPVLGSADAKVTLVEYLDPECETCRVYNQFVKQLYREYGGKLRIVVRYMPFHGNSRRAASYLEAAREQGKFWEMLDLAFERQPEWGDRHGHPSDTPQEPFQVLFERYAAELGLDLNLVRASVSGNKFDAYIQRDFADGQSLGVTRTPTFYVNGRELLRFSQQDLRALVESEMKAN